MVALTNNAPRRSRGLTRKGSYPVAAGVRIYAGALVMINSAGYAAPAAASAGNLGGVGVASREANNTSGANGAINVETEDGEFLFAADTAAQTIVNRGVYADDDNTIDETQLANTPLVGIATEFVSASQVWVLVERSVIRGILGA